MNTFLSVIIGLVVVGILVSSVVVATALILGARAERILSNQDKEQTNA